MIFCFRTKGISNLVLILFFLALKGYLLKKYDATPIINAHNFEVAFEKQKYVHLYKGPYNDYVTSQKWQI